MLYTVVPTRTNTVGESSTAPGTHRGVDFETGRAHVVLRAGADRVLRADGPPVYGVGQTLYAVDFDASRLVITGNPVQVSSDVGSSEFALSNEGTLVYASATGRGQRTLVWVDRHGREELVGAPTRGYIYPRLSPDGTRIAIDVGGANRDIWIWDIGRQCSSVSRPIRPRTRCRCGRVTGAAPLHNMSGAQYLETTGRRQPRARASVKSDRLQQPYRWRRTTA